jgi:hypothetical protein
MFKYFRNVFSALEIIGKHLGAISTHLEYLARAEKHKSARTGYEIH